MQGAATLPNIKAIKIARGLNLVCNGSSVGKLMVN